MVMLFISASMAKTAFIVLKEALQSSFEEKFKLL